MMLKFSGFVVVGLFAVIVAAAAKSGADDGRVLFNRDIRPIFSDTCFKCHGPDSAARKADLRLDTEAGAFTERDGIVPFVPGHPDKSEGYRRVISDDPDEMMPPPESNLAITPAQKELIRKWIEQGAKYEKHWALTPAVRAAQPRVNDPGWVRNPIDRFVLARLTAEGLRPSPEAPRHALVRRLYLDLTGLPPTLAELDVAMGDGSQDWYERLVDRLLDSASYGERMAVEWLDAARYADTHGYHIDSHRDMWRWREWVIDSFARNKPFDEFTVEQLAGDLLPGATVDQQVATGFNRNHMINFEGGAIPEEYHAAYIVDRVNTVGQVWLGLTVGCAQCHDHKYDPILQKEYYQLYALFHNVPEQGLDGQKGNAAPFLKLPTAQQAAQLDAARAAVAGLEKELARRGGEAQGDFETWVSGESAKPPPATGEGAKADPIRAILIVAQEQRTDEQKQTLRKHYLENHDAEYKRINAELAAGRKKVEEIDKSIPTTMVMKEMETPRETFLLMRGEYDKKGEKVTPGVPASLGALPVGAPANRLGLARWLVAPDHPLTARVVVNRYWQRYFGNGIVKTAEDLGSQGEWPTHPELLDWLATEFVRTGWDVKAMQRLIVTSAAYRQDSRVTHELHDRDPENRLLARGPRFRLPAETIRDQALAVGGLLSTRIGGESVMPYHPKGLWEEMAWGDADMAKNPFTAQAYVQAHGESLYRRTMYTFWKRTVPPAQLSTFDAPDRETCTVRRLRTNTPLQALVLMNDPTYVESARKFAERILTEAPAGMKERIGFAFRTVTSRAPSAKEEAVLQAIYDQRLADFHADPSAAEQFLGVGESPRHPALDPAELAAWASVASVILSLDETISKG